MKLISLFREVFIIATVILVGLYGISVTASTTTLSNVYVPLDGEVTLPNGDVVTFSGEVHVLTRVTFSDEFVPTVNMYVNLIGVEGTSATTGKRYLVVGASSLELVGGNPGPPTIPDQTFSFSLVEVAPGPPNVSPGPPTINPGPPILSVFLRDFVFAQEAGSEGSLQNVIASFSI